MRLSNKVALITGANKGIGKATALKFAKEGAKVVVCDLDDAVAETVAEIHLQGGSAIGFKVDVTKAESIDAMVSGALATYGHIDVNLKGAYNCTKAVVDAMIERKGGVVLNASSIVGIYGNFGQTNYAASKFGVIGMAKTWARELGKHGKPEEIASTFAFLASDEASYINGAVIEVCGGMTL